jgi:hypothetical protein
LSSGCGHSLKNLAIQILQAKFNLFLGRKNGMT